eukprot:TRINITY_DN9751_c0_g1_i2.p1 TRINITY_DN9751_c0_g1~~TRINITY_DN9751_c0_g1_i2.p1  ORF type:complete len:207 (+),score=24.46 TRINITY_DN9751_c0_g1_i2:206-826(+)
MGYNIKEKMPKPKAGSLGIFCLFGISNICLIGLGGVIVFIGAITMIKAGYNHFHLIACGAGLITSVIGVFAFCGRRSIGKVSCFIFLEVLLLAAYIALTIIFAMDILCDIDNEICKTLEDYGVKNLMTYFLIGSDVLNLLILILAVCYRGSLASNNESGINLLSETKEIRTAREHIEKSRMSVDQRKKEYAEKYPEMVKYATKDGY